MTKITLYMSAWAILFAACTPNADSKKQNTMEAFNSDSLKEHIKILASDSFQGRRPFSAGETKTVNYLTSVFTSYGLEPGNGNSFLQDVPLVEITPHADSLLKVQSAKGSITLQRTTDYVLSTQSPDSVTSLNNDEVVFAGFGVVAPEYKWNDYEGINVKGKVVLVLVNDPGFGSGDSTLFKGNTMTYYGRWTYKYEEAARQGAKACIIIHNTAAASYPFSVVQDSWGSANLFLDTRGSNEYHCALRGWITGDATKRLLQAAGRDSSLIAQAHRRGFKAVPLAVRLSTTLRVKAVYSLSHNIIAKITGSKRPEEYVIYTAHWDHLGVGKPDKKGDSIYNGALDNASGTAALLEMAKAFKQLSPAPERTVIFLSVTAEEQGLLGSAYYAQHPLYPLHKTVAELNMDIMNAYDKKKDVIITGQGQSELEDYVIQQAQAQGRYISPEPHPEGGSYFRSDHFNFAKAGVPALDLGVGIDVAGKGKEYGRKLQEDYTQHHYHSPSDEYNPAWTFEGGLQDMQLLFKVGKRLAFESSWPAWKQGSEFKAIRDKSK